MKSELHYLNKIIDLKKWQDLQDSLAQVTGMAIITVDYKGIPITEHSSRHKFCTLVRTNPELSKHCQRCDSRGGLEATRLNEPYIYRCHYNIVDAAIPIIVDDKYLGAIMVGQVLLSSQRDNEELELISFPSDKEKLAEQTQQYEEYFNELPRLSLNRVKMIVDMLFHLCKYIVEEALEKNLALEMCAGISAQGIPAGVEGNRLSYPIKSMENVSRHINNVITSTKIKETADFGEATNNRILRPAFEYINEHKGESFSLGRMAEICHISPSYFSRLFTKETGENFSTFLSRLKINWAKQLLETTDKPVSQISLDLGFSEAGYFIKIFKKQEGITPFLYRRYYRRK